MSHHLMSLKLEVPRFAHQPGKLGGMRPSKGTLEWSARAFYCVLSGMQTPRQTIVVQALLRLAFRLMPEELTCPTEQSSPFLKQ